MATWNQTGIESAPFEKYSRWVEIKLWKETAKEWNTRKGAHVARFNYYNSYWELRYFHGGKNVIYMSEVEGWREISISKMKLNFKNYKKFRLLK